MFYSLQTGSTSLLLRLALFLEIGTALETWRLAWSDLAGKLFEKKRVKKLANVSQWDQTVCEKSVYLTTS